MSDNQKGILLTFTAIILFATISPVARMAYAAYPDLDPVVLVQVRMNAASLIFFVIQLIRDPKKLKLTKEELLFAAILGVVGLFGVQYTLFAAVKRIPVGLATFIQSGAALFICLYSFVALREKFPLNRLIGLLTGFFGIFLIFWNKEAFSSRNIFGTGLLWALFSAFTRSFYVLWGKRNKTGISPGVLLAYAFGAGGLFSLLLGPGKAASFIAANYEDPRIWLYFAVLTLFGTVAAFFCSFKGLTFVPATTNAYITVTEPMFATFAAFLLTGELITLREGIGCALIAASAVFVQLNIRSMKVVSLPARRPKNG